MRKSLPTITEESQTLMAKQRNTSDRHQKQKLLMLYYLKSGSPELNPIERVWQSFKQRLFRETYSSLETLQAAITAILKQTSDAVIAKMTAFPFFINAAKQI